MNGITKYWQLLLSLAVALMVFAFWRWAYPFALTYHEQFQLFLLDGDYLLSRLAQPGGLARYVGEFAVQFYNNVTVGAAILALLYMAVQRMTWALCRRVNANAGNACYMFSFLPLAALWLLMGDENVMMSFVMAYVGQLALLLLAPQRQPARTWFFIVIVVLGWWLLGPVILMAVVFAATMAAKEGKPLLTVVAHTALLVVIALTCILLSRQVVNYPLAQLFYGIDYYRLPAIFPYMALVLEGVTVLLPFMVAALPEKRGRAACYVNIVTGAVVAVAFVLLMPVFFDARKYDLIEYDYLVRQQRWDEVIAKSERKMPALPMSVSSTNLALGMNGQIGDRLFEFYQNGSEGLLPRFERNHFTALAASEIYYRLGLTNTAQRFAFEAQEAIPNYNKSARVMKRLVETNVINGQLAVARKYLALLSKTVFYSKWAARMTNLINNKREIDRHPEYGYMRRCHLDKDFLYSEAEGDKIMGLLFMKNKDNSLAMQYMAVCPLLQRDVKKLMQYLPYIENHTAYNPKAVQEGVAMACMQMHQQPPQGFIDQTTEQNFRSFAQTYAQKGRKAPELEMYSNTFWYYMMVR